MHDRSIPEFLASAARLLAAAGATRNDMAPFHACFIDDQGYMLVGQPPYRNTNCKALLLVFLIGMTDGDPVYVRLRSTSANTTRQLSQSDAAVASVASIVS